MKLTSQDRNNILLVLLLGMAVGLAFGLSFYARFPEKCDDIDEFGLLAARFAADLTFGGSVRRAPVYPFLLSTIYLVFGPHNHTALIAFQALCLSFLGAGFYLFSKKAYGSSQLALGTGFLIILNPFVIWYVPRIWIELVFTLLTSVMVFAAYLALRYRTPRTLIFFGLATGLSALCKAVTLLFPLFLALSLVVLRTRPSGPFSHFPMKKIAGFLLIPTAVAALTISPWTIRNRIVTGRWILVSTNLGVEYHRGDYLARHNSFLISRKTLVDTLGDCVAEENRLLQGLGKDPALISGLEKEDVFRNLMWEDIRSGPQQHILKTLKQIPAFWYKGNAWWTSLYFLGQSAVFLALFGTALFHLRRRRELGVLVGLFIVYMTLLHASLVAIARYSLPLYPLMTLVIAAWWMDKRQRLRETREKGGSGDHRRG
jgi:hypothetical protein